METICLRPGLEIPREAIEAFCRRHHITWLAVFGSVLRDDFAPTSDIDILVEYAPEQTPSLFGRLKLEEELSEILQGRSIDLGTRQYLNRWLKDRVLSEARVIYDAA